MCLNDDDFFAERLPSDIIASLDSEASIGDGQIISAAADAAMLRETMNFYNDTALLCSGYFSCAMTDVSFINASSAHVLCNESYACMGSKLTLSAIGDASIICNGEHTCDDMSIHIESEAGSNVSIDCGQSSSCENVHIAIDGAGASLTSCIGYRACDGLFLGIDGDHYETHFLKMYEWSESVIFSNGYGPFEVRNDSGTADTVEYVSCLDERVMPWDNAINSPAVLEPILLSEFAHDTFPCDALTVECHDNTTKSSCKMSAQFSTENAPSVSGDDCLWLPVVEFTHISCNGDCASSPTMPPTLSPTDTPTVPSESPTDDPTADPTTDPSADPTDSPSRDPTSDPTNDPSADPTADPSADPTRDPTTNPSANPTRDPTADPTINPTSDPTAAPSEYPTVNPTKDPTKDPTADPTRAPTTADAYDSYFTAHFKLEGLTTDIVVFIGDSVSAVAKNISFLIENGIDDNGILQVSQVWVQLTHFNGHGIDELVASDNAARDLSNAEMNLFMTASIMCNAANCQFIIGARDNTGFDLDKFENFMTNALRNYFEAEMEPSVDADGNGRELSQLTFSVEDMSAALSLYSSPVAETNYTFLGMVSLCATLSSSLLGFAACIFNKIGCAMPPCKIVDNSRWSSVMVIALQIWDFGSDVSLSLEVWSRDDLLTRTVIKVVAFLSSAFVVGPYFVNLFVAARIRTYGNVIRRNEAASTYFEHKQKLFIFLVVLTGGCHPALEMVSSNIFGLPLFSSGLTRYELKQLAVVKVFNTVVLENVPQLIIQIIYTVAIGGATDNVRFAFIASVLSVIATLLSFCLNRGDGDEAPAEYYLSVQCTRGDRGLEATNKLTDDEEQKIRKNRGKRLQLSKALATMWHIPSKCIEIGATVLGDHGARVHVVHYNGNAQAIELKYGEMQGRVTQMLTQHFELSDEFRVEFIKCAPYSDVSIEDKLEATLAEFMLYCRTPGDEVALSPTSELEKKCTFVVSALNRSLTKQSTRLHMGIVSEDQVMNDNGGAVALPEIAMVELGTRGGNTAGGDAAAESVELEVMDGGNGDEPESDVQTPSPKLTVQPSLQYKRTNSMSGDEMKQWV